MWCTCTLLPVRKACLTYVELEDQEPCLTNTARGRESPAIRQMGTERESGGGLGKSGQRDLWTSRPWEQENSSVSDGRRRRDWAGTPSFIDDLLPLSRLRLQGERWRAVEMLSMIGDGLLVKRERVRGQRCEGVKTREREQRSWTQSMRWHGWYAEVWVCTTRHGRG